MHSGPRDIHVWCRLPRGRAAKQNEACYQAKRVGGRRIVREGQRGGRGETRAGWTGGVGYEMGGGRDATSGLGYPLISIVSVLGG